jgi:glycosyltransferase involved in cell wall biosynthesis
VVDHVVREAVHAGEDPLAAERIVVSVPRTVPSEDVAPRITVVLPVRDGAATLGAQLDALVRQSLAQPWEVIVADNGSRDATRELAESYRGRLPLRVVDASQRRGAAHARNVGAAAARAPLLAFVDADDVVADDWLAVTVAALEEHPIVVPRFDKTRLNSAEQQLLRDLPQERGLAKHNYAPFLPHAGGCGLALRRSLHDDIGGFDVALERLQDTDYTWRLQLAGHPLHYEPAALVHVRFRSTVSGSLSQGFRYGWANGSLYARYVGRGMGAVSLGSDLQHLAAGALGLLRPGDAQTRHRRLRALVNRLGIVLGRLHAALRFRARRPRKADPAITQLRGGPWMR